MTAIFDSTTWAAIVQALLHSLWQGALAGLVLLVALKLIPARRANLRYGLALASLGAVVAGCVVTWSWIERQGTQPQVASSPAPALVAAPVGISEAGPATHASESVATPGDAGTRGSAAGSGSAVNTPASHDGVPRWTRWAALVWLAGALIFQLRLFASVSGARRLARGSRPVEDTAVLERFWQLAERLGLSRRIELRESEGLGVPVVFGLLRPMVLVPASMILGISRVHLQAVLAHELAHIRRHDYAVNLCQLVIEGTLFFNPFVWWISRRIRLEREACCDAIAVEASGERTGYAHALAEIAEAGLEVQAVPAPALAMSEGRGQLLDRVRRLVEPQSSPPLRLAPMTTLGLLVLCLSSLALLKVTSAVAVEILSPGERIERFAELRGQYPNYELERIGDAAREPEPITLRGTVRTADGKPLPVPTQLVVHSRTATQSAASDGRVAADGTFSHTVRADTVALRVEAGGYAPAFLGPISPARASEDLEQIELVLSEGFSATLRFVNEAGAPIEGVELTGGYELIKGIWSHSIVSVSDSQGMLRLDALGERPLALRVEADFHQPADRDQVVLGPDEVYTWVIEEAKPARGTVVFGETGQPVAGAGIYLGARQIGEASYLSHGSLDEKNLLARTDAQGRFTLHRLRDDADYYLLIAGPDASPIVAGPVHSGQSDLRFELPRAQFLTIRVEDVTEEDLNAQGALELRYSVTLRYGRGGSSGTSETFRAIPENGVAEFRVGPLWQGRATFSIGSKSVAMEWKDVIASTEPLVIDLESEREPAPEVAVATRKLEIVFRVPRESAAPEGLVVVEYPHQGRMERQRIPVSGERVEVEIPTPARVEISPSQMIGYWFAPKRSPEISEGDEPYQVELELVPAGAIHGTVLEENGEPAGGLLFSAVPAPPRLEERTTILGIEVKSSTSAHDHDSRFMAGPLPFDAPYYIVAHRGATYVVSDPLFIDAQTPFHEITLVMPKGVEVSGRVLDPDGRPLARQAVELSYGVTPWHGFGGRRAFTRRDGTFSFSDMNPDVPGEYRVSLKFEADFQPAAQVIVFGEPLEFHVKPGRVIEGRVVEAGTGQPLGNAEVYAIWRSRPPDEILLPGWFDAEAPTDSEGRFRFSTLPDGEFAVHSRTGRLRTRDINRRAGSGEQVLLEIEPYDWIRVGR